MRKSVFRRELEKQKSETTEQMNLFSWIRREAEEDTRLKWAFHTENERKCSKEEGAKRKLMGVKKGVSDIVVPYPCGCYHGLFIELKYDSGRLQPEQEEFLSDMNRYGYYSCACYSKETAQEVIRRYLSLQGQEILVLLDENMQTGKVKYTKLAVPVIKPFAS